MTYGRMKSMLRVLLTGDNVLPNNDEDMVAALEMSYIEISNMATALKLLTVNKDQAIMRQGPGSTFVRMPDLPRDDTDELDIDSELVPAVARIIASYLSKEKGGIHMALAKQIILQYESKVQEFLLSQEQQGLYEESLRY